MEIERLRWAGIDEGALVIPANSERKIGIEGRELEIKVEIESGSSSCGIKVFCSPDGQEETVIKYDPVTEELVIDFSKSAASGNGRVTMKPNTMFEPQLEGFTQNISEQRAPLKLSSGESLVLDIFIDRSVIEVFANGRQCLTQVVYPELDNSTGVVLFAGDEYIKVLSAKAWKMGATNLY